MDRKGPKGIANFKFLPLINMTVIPMTVPTADEIKIVKITPFQPIIVPIIARSLISPPPIPSLLVIRLYTHATIKRLPPPASKPRAESFKVTAGKAKEATRPTSIPGSVIISGMILWSISINVIISSDEIKAKYISTSKLRPNAKRTLTAMIPHITSTSR